MLKPTMTRHVFSRYVFFVKKSHHGWDALRDLVIFGQCKKRGKHPWRSVSFSKVVGFSLKKETYGIQNSHLQSVHLFVNIRNQQTKLENWLRLVHIQSILDQCSISIPLQDFTLIGLIFVCNIFCSLPGFWSFQRNLIRAKNMCCGNIRLAKSR